MCSDDLHGRVPAVPGRRVPVTAGRNLLRGVAFRTLRLLTWLLLRLLPSRPYALVHGWPDNEANALEVLRGLLRRYPGRVYWLLEDISFLAVGAAPLEDERLVRLRKGSLTALRVGLTAEVVFFTHGLVTAVAPPAHRLVVNLWHGDGPKSTRQPRRVRSTVVVSGADLWADYKSRLFRVSRDRVLVTGNPRIDQFDQPVPEAVQRQLGLDPTRPRVLWLPTYREAQGPNGRAWRDSEPLSGNDSLAEVAQALGVAARALGVDLVIKPHPLDGDSYAGLGCRVLTGAELDRAGVTLYQLLGGCDALISDISSVWVDYLVLDRPVGFCIPDLDELERRRGLNVPDVAAVLPGPRLEDPAQARTFLEQVVRGDPRLRPSAWPAAARIGVTRQTDATDRLLDALDALQTRRGRSPLFTAGTAVQAVRTSR